MRRSLVLVALLAPTLAMASESWSYAYDNPTAQAADQAPAQLAPEQVRLVQRTLHERGYRVELTGKLDRDTRKALKRFQKAEKLAVTGALDGATARALGVDPAGVMPVRGETTEQRSGSAPEDTDSAYRGPG